MATKAALNGFIISDAKGGIIGARRYFVIKKALFTFKK